MTATVSNDEEYGSNGYLSSDSSFYGDADTKAELEERCENYDPTRYWSNHPYLVSVMAAANRAKSHAASSSPTRPLYNPYEGRINARQLNETVEEFLKRLPPLTTSVSREYPWIFVANPHASLRPTDYDQGAFMRDAEETLQEFTKKKSGIESSMAGKAKASITRKLTPLRKTLEEKLLAKAKEKRFTSGKWMLFPSPDDVNSQWALVAEATVNRELGTAAKVAPDSGDGDRNPRLICVYTKDFSDMDDVKRVLERLVELGLVKRKDDRGIYYKANAFTELGINAGNEWGLKASLYASKDLLGGKK
ncbi:MAG: hypothetical protein LQ345_005806 [Seirophora villosa]|nr:MAG: hypothetical protein LQ345_005806 [Seirophora villosa]